MKIKEFIINLRYDLFELPKRKKFAIVAILIAAAVFFWGAGKFQGFKAAAKEKTKAAQKGPVSVKVFQVRKAPFKDTISLLGEIRGIAEMEMKFEAPGVVSSINHREGEFVKKGELLASLDQKEALLKARHSEIEYENKKKLHAIGGISDSALEQAKCEHELAMGELEKTILVAPKDGVVGDWHVEAGEYITPNDRAITFVDTKEILVECGVIETDLPKVALGQKANATVDAFSGAQFGGAVVMVSKVIEGRSRTAPIKIKINDSSKRLLPGMFARAAVTIFEAEDVLAVPVPYFHIEEGKYLLWLARKNEFGEFVAQKTPVEIGYFSDDYLLVSQGASDGDSVITEVPFGLAPGDRITVAEIL